MKQLWDNVKRGLLVPVRIANVASSASIWPTVALQVHGRDVWYCSQIAEYFCCLQDQMEAKEKQLKEHPSSGSLANRWTPSFLKPR
jgi:hypothetical protein